MNIFKKTSTLLLFVVVFQLPLLAQKKLALANECFQAKAYYLASRYYQDFFGKMNDNDCHPDQLKMAQSLAFTQQLAAAESVFQKYMDCQKNSPAANFAYGKFLLNIEAYKKAIPYFEKAIEAEPQLAPYYMLACQTALCKPVEEGTSIFVNQVIEPSESLTSAQTDRNSAIVGLVDKVQSVTPINLSSQDSIQRDKTTSGTKETNLFDAIVSAEKNVEKKAANITSPQRNNIARFPNNSTVPKEKLGTLAVKKKISPYGVRLGTYKKATIPDLSSIKAYGKVEQKKWNGRTILFLVDFPDRAAAEAAVTIARREKFRFAILVEKLASGRMKSVK